jgi:hypothetical protein
MRDPARIDRVLAELRAAWMAAPDLRLGQLLLNALPQDHVRPQTRVEPSDETMMREKAAAESAAWSLEDDVWEQALGDFRERVERDGSVG